MMTLNDSQTPKSSPRLPDEDALLAAALRSRRAWKEVTLANARLSAQGQLILSALTDYYGSDADAPFAEVNLLGLYLDDAEAQQHVVRLAAAKVDMTPAAIGEGLRRVRERRCRLQLADSLLRGTPDIQERMLAWESSQGTSKTQARPLSMDDYSTAATTKHPFRLKVLNHAFRGGLSRGNSVLAFARPDGGKTLLAVDYACHLALQGYESLYWANEEGRSSLGLRFLSCLTSYGLPDLENDDNLRAAFEEAKEPLSRIHIINNGEWSGLAPAVQRLQPLLVVVDQLRELDDAEADMTRDMERRMRQLRRLSTAADCIVITLAQAGANADDKAVLATVDMDSSKTGAQGACDALIGIGSTPSLREDKERVLSVPRNKIAGICGHWRVGIEQPHSRFKDVA